MALSTPRAIRFRTFAGAHRLRDHTTRELRRLGVHTWRCAIVATPRRSSTPDDGYPNNLDVLITVSDLRQDRLDTVAVTTSRTRSTGMHQVYADGFDDHPFSLVVSC